MNRSYTKACIVQKIVNSKQIRFHQKGRVEAEEEASELSARSYLPEGKPPDEDDAIWSELRLIHCVQLWSWNGDD